MNLALSPDQTQLQDAVRRVLADHSTGNRIRAAEATGFDAALWALLCELGIPALRMAAQHGGSDAGLFEAVLVAELAGRFLASAPVVEAMVAGRLLSRLGDEAVRTLLPEPGAVVTLALHDVGRRPRQLVAQGSIALTILCIDGETVHAVQPHNPAAPANLGSLAIGDIDFNAGLPRTMVATGTPARHHFEAAVEEWKLLTAAFVAGGAQRAIEMASEYARERVAFGRPIGSFQGLAHPLVDVAVDIDGARLMVWRAVDALAKGEADAAARLSMASWWTAQAAGGAVTQAIRVFGGYGMSLEYDAQLYFRRLMAVSLLAGDPDDELAAAADRLWDGAAPAALPEAGALDIDFDWDAASAEPIERMRRFCEPRNDAAMQHFQHSSDDWHQPALCREMAAAGLLYPDWPAEYGGGGLRAIDAAALNYTLGDLGWYMLPRMTTHMVGTMILHFGSEAARREILPRLASGQAYASLGYSEPSSGSDVFAVRTKAVLHGDEWRIDGQKMFTSQGHLADYCLLIARTGPDKHRGVTLFAVPLAQAGYSYTEIKTLGDERTNVTFYEDVRVPDRYRLGEVDGGVKVLAAALTLEQSGDIYWAALKTLLGAALDWARSGDAVPAPIGRPGVRRALAELAVRVQVQDVLTRRTVWAAAAGQAQKHHGPMAKLFGSESLVAASARLLRLAAPASLLKGGHALGMIERESRRSLPATIYAGTSEIQRSLIGESALGLPRSR